MGEQDAEGEKRANSCGQAGAEDPHIHRKDKEIVPKDVKDTTCENGRSCESRGAVVPEKSGEHLVE